MQVQEALELFISESGNKKLSVKIYTSLARYVAPSWGYQYPDNIKRLSPCLKQELISFLKKIDISECKYMLNIFEESIKDFDSNSKNIWDYRSALRNFYDWCEDKKYFKSKRSRISYLIQPKYPTNNNIRSTKAKSPVVYALMAKKQNKSKTLYFKDDYVNHQLGIDLENYKYYRASNKVVIGTIKKDIGIYMQFLGWLHRYRNVSLEELRLTSIIKYYPLSSAISEERDIVKLNLKNDVLRKEAIENAYKNLNLIKDYLEFKKDTSDNTKKTILRVLIVLARYIFKDEIGKDLSFMHSDDIPIVKLLLILNDEITEPKFPQVPHQEKMISWDKALEVLEILRHNAKATRYPKDARKINIAARSKHLQNFLAVAFCTLIPPDRTSVYSSLQINQLGVNALLKGDYKNGKFIFEDMMDVPSNAKWYIHLKEYKTVKTYGEYWSLPIPNYQFKDGAKFYDYIDEWLKSKRNFSNEIEHNFFFRKCKTLEPFTPDDWTYYIKNRFYNYTSVFVNPNSLRHMYATHIRNIGSTQDEKEAVAYSMHHHVKTGGTVYNEQSKYDKMKAVQEVNKRILKDIIK